MEQKKQGADKGCLPSRPIALPQADAKENSAAELQQRDVHAWNRRLQARQLLRQNKKSCQLFNKKGKGF